MLRPRASVPSLPAGQAALQESSWSPALAPALLLLLAPRRLQPPSPPRHLERRTEPCPAPTEPRSWPPAPTPSGPNFPLSVVSSRTPLRYLRPTPTCSPAGPVLLNPNRYLPPQLVPSVPLRFSLVVCLSLAFMRLCRTYNGNIVEFLEPVSGYGNTLHNAFGGEHDNFPYAFSHPSFICGK